MARRARAREPPPAARDKIAGAHLAVVDGDLPRATALLKEAVRLAPNYPDAYETLGSVAADAGDGGRKKRERGPREDACVGAPPPGAPGEVKTFA